MKPKKLVNKKDQAESKVNASNKNSNGKKKNLTSQKKQFSNTAKFQKLELLAALVDLDELMDRLVCKYILLGNIPEQMRRQVFIEDKKIWVGVNVLEMIESKKNNLKIIKPDAEFTDKYVKYTFNGIPVHIKLIHRSYQFFDFPTEVVYAYDRWPIPNNWEKYWKMRYLIR